MSELTERARALYERTGDLDFIDGSLGLSSPEMRVLAAFLVAEGNYGKARALLPKFDKLTFDRQAVSLNSKGWIGREDSLVVFDETRLRLQTPEEPERERGQRPVIRVVKRPMRERLIMMVQAGKNPVAGLADVYTELYGGSVNGRDWGMLGKILQALGPSRAPVFLLEFASKPMQNPLAELMPLAVARGKGYGRVETAERVEERKANAHAMDYAALKSRLKIYKMLDTIPEHLAAQYERDMMEYNRVGCPPLENM